MILDSGGSYLGVWFVKLVYWGIIWLILNGLPIICVLLAIGFFTLFERKLLGSMMLRKGPNKVGFMGLLQPFSDAGKLFCKEVNVPRFANVMPFVIAPVFMLMISMSLWIMYPFSSVGALFIFGVLQFLATAGVSVYGVMVAGWSSNSKYSLLGSVRSVAQSISYEISFSLIIFVLVLMSMSFFIQEISFWQEGAFMFVMAYLMGLVLWMVCILAENHRAPFDFVEGESELVSGFNVEYSGGLFAMIFMAEYGSMLFSSILSACLFFGGSEVFMSIVFLFFDYFFVWVRGSFPRMRYDKLMKIGWTVFMVIPFIFSLLVFYILCF
uniref:NADH-ubiquinone oxidoreductase chain 1 n=1 Tax=Mytilisepta keenae TaxID=2590091 RepID=A0A516EZC6_9BIVA|nr:NADH dehydrogenase subunit 1 [Mytilisepta keenae]QDO71858.1 NADH dehydrogenase subunit 1 [Mytilisepta keenae]